MTHDSAREDVVLEVPRFEPGAVVAGKYVVTQLLGVGGTGAVYEATHEAVGHRIAIKVVHQELAMHEDIIERFRREAQMCGTIRDRHVGQIYDVGQLPDGAPYMVMELQVGEPFEDLLKRKTLPIATVIDAGRQLLAGLSAAHAVNVVHRDVKPGNLILTGERDGEHLLKLVDFGISKHVTRDITERSVTAEGAMIGSPDYMPPEQLRGTDIDHRADIYAAGVVLYEAVTGRMPFDAASLTDLMAAILRDPVMPPSTLRVDCPPALSRVIQRAMSRNRVDRFGSAEEMSTALSQIAARYRFPEGAKAWNVEGFPPAGSVATFPTSGKATTHGRPFSLRAVPMPVDTGRFRTAAPQLLKKRSWHLYALGGAAVSAVLLIAPISVDDHEPRSALVDVPPPELAATASAAAPILPMQLVEPVPEVVAAKQTPPDERATAAAKRRTAAKTPSVDAATLVGGASAAFVHGHFPRAMTLYRQAVTASPSHAVAWRGLGMTAMKMDRRRDARAAFDRYLELTPSAPDAARIRERLAEL